MKWENQDFFCEEVRRLWLSLESRPWGVWIREHTPVGAPDYALITDVQAAWFLDSGTISIRSPSEFVRFHTIHGTQPWHSGMWPVASEIFRPGTHEIGLAGFAPVAGSELFYFEWQFGGGFGRGSTYTLDSTGCLRVAEAIYIS
jgi:hypothetical protein